MIVFSGRGSISSPFIFQEKLTNLKSIYLYSAVINNLLIVG